MAGAKTGKDWKTTNDMSASERRALQLKLDAMLQDSISDVKALGYPPRCSHHEQQNPSRIGRRS